MQNGKVKPLNSLERTQLRNAEAIIQEHLGKFVEVGQALSEIRDKRLYRETHNTFEAYLSDRWNLNRQYAYRLIAASEVVQNVSPVVKTSNNSDKSLPILTENHVRPLTCLPPEKQKEALQIAIAKARETEKPLTATIIKEVVEELAEEDAKEKESNGENREHEVEDPLSARVLQAIVTERIKPTEEQRERLGRLPEDEQEAILDSVLAGRQTLRQALDEGPADPTPEEVGKLRALEIDRLCKEILRLVNEEIEKGDPWILEKRNLIEADLRALTKTLHSCKATYPCPSCSGSGCKTCKDTGRVNKYTRDLVL